jgi:hypothetical protein
MPDPRRIQPDPDPDPYQKRGSADPELDSRGSGNIADSRELQEICQDLRSHEEHVHCNRSSIFNLVFRFHELKNQNST